MVFTEHGSPFEIPEDAIIILIFDPFCPVLFAGESSIPPENNQSMNSINHLGYHNWLYSAFYWLFSMSLLFSLASGCGPTVSTPPPANTLSLIVQTSAPVPTFTVEPTSEPIQTKTPIPTPTDAPNVYQAQGKLWLDGNGDGEPDNMYFVWNKKYWDNFSGRPELLSAVKAQLLAIKTPKEGSLVSIIEPALHDNLKVCWGDQCTVPSLDGNFSLQLEGYKTNSDPPTVPITIQDTSNKLEEQIRYYTLLTKKGVEIPASGSIPAYVLNATDTWPLHKRVIAQLTTPNLIGLMQGFLTSPYRKEDYEKFTICNTKDLDPRKGYILRWDGTTGPLLNNKFLPDQHTGTDFCGPHGLLVLTPATGSTYWFDTGAYLEGDGFGMKFGTAHMEPRLIENSPGIQMRGYVAGRNGGYNYGGGNKLEDHIHLMLYKSVGTMNVSVDPFRTKNSNELGPIDYADAGDLVNHSSFTTSEGYWSVPNLIIFPNVKYSDSP